MNLATSRRCFLACLAALLVSAGGCSALSETPRTEAADAGGRVLHLAIVPRQLPDGSDPAEQVARLLKEVAARAGGYTYIEGVKGGWIPPGEQQVVTESNDLLLVEGPPELARFLKEALRDDFAQEYPFVVSLPVRPAPMAQSASTGTVEPEVNPSD